VFNRFWGVFSVEVFFVVKKLKHIMLELPLLVYLFGVVHNRYSSRAKALSTIIKASLNVAR
jgi:hypothetical protein